MTLQKAESFVPLSSTATTAENREFHVTIIPQTETTRTFQTLEQAALKSGDSGSLHGRKNCEPVLSLQRDGDRITHIRVQCSCGQVMELACLYDERLK